MENQSSLSRYIRVCHVAHGDLWAGAEVQLVTLLDAFVRMPGLEYSAVLLNEGRLAEELRKTGVRVTVFSEEKHNSVQLLIYLIKYFKNCRPDIVHTHKYKDNILGSPAATLAGVPHVVRSVHGMTEPFRGREYVNMAFYELVDRLVNKWTVRKIIAVSSNIATTLRRTYAYGKVVCIHNGINLRKVQAAQTRSVVREWLGVGTDEYLVGTVGRLTTVKGHDILMRMASSLLKEMPKTKVVIVGDGPLMQSLGALARKLKIEKEVILVGQRDDVYDLINAMDVFVLPSLHEGIPMVLLEALALGRPVVASRVGGIPEIVSHGVEGLLVEPGSSEELKQNIRLLMNDKPYADKLAKAGRKRVEETFSGEAMAERTACLYSALMTDDRAQ